MPGNVMQNPREHVLAELAVPANWRKVDEQRVPENIDRPTVVVRHSRISRLPAAPIGHLEHEVILAVFVPHKDLAKAEDALDTAITELLMLLDGHESITWEEAEKVVTPNEQYPGWELTLKVITTNPATA